VIKAIGHIWLDKLKGDYIMKRSNLETMILTFSTVVLLLLGTIAPTYALQEQGAKSPNQEQPTKGQQDEKPKAKGKKKQQKHAEGPQDQKDEQHGVWQQHRAHSWKAEHRTWQQRGGYNGFRIPEDHFRGHFGPGHAFRIYSYPMVVVSGYPRFQYGGYWLSVVDPWPEYWSDNWYHNDDVYINYSGDGYYLFNRRHPRDRIAITVFQN
jgi:hypothetical protein